jgi:hypothetical protein
MPLLVAACSLPGNVKEAVMTVRSKIALCLAAASLVLAAPLAQAQPHRDRHEHDRGRGWHGDIRHFHEHDIGRWRGGHWYHGRYGGRLGWWWIVSGVYYFYPQPVYPYPDPYTPPVVVAPPVAAAPAPAPAPSSGTWYYCDAAGAYYPYVADCPSGWRPVPATPTR